MWDMDRVESVNHNLPHDMCACLRDTLFTQYQQRDPVLRARVPLEQVLVTMRELLDQAAAIV